MVGLRFANVDWTETSQLAIPLGVARGLEGVFNQRIVSAKTSRATDLCQSRRDRLVGSYLWGLDIERSRGGTDPPWWALPSFPDTTSTEWYQGQSNLQLVGMLTNCTIHENTTSPPAVLQKSVIRIESSILCEVGG